MLVCRRPFAGPYYNPASCIRRLISLTMLCRLTVKLLAPAHNSLSH